MATPRLTTQTIKVIGALAARPREELSGAQIAKDMNMMSGTLYPILFRLEEAGWLQSRWEEDEPSILGRPRRRYYRVTPLGAKALHSVADKLSPFAFRLSST